MYVTRRLRKDGSTYYGPYFPGNLAHRLVHFIHRHFQVPSCKVDFSRVHKAPCLQYHIHRCLGPCVEGLTTDEAYARAVRNVRLFLEGRHRDLTRDASAADGGRCGGHALRGGGEPARPDLDRGGDGAEAEDGGREGRRCRYLRVLRRAAAGGGESVPHAQRADRRPARVLLGGPAGVRCAASSSRRC